MKEKIKNKLIKIFIVIPIIMPLSVANAINNGKIGVKDALWETFLGNFLKGIAPYLLFILIVPVFVIICSIFKKKRIGKNNKTSVKDTKNTRQ